NDDSDAMWSSWVVAPAGAGSVPPTRCATRPRGLAILPSAPALHERLLDGLRSVGRPVGAGEGMAGCPSGQRELTVNQPAQPTWVRIPHLPPGERPARPRVVRGALSSAGLAEGRRSL